MKFIEAECPNCGAQLQLDNKLEKAFCSHCGSQIIVDKAIELKNTVLMPIDERIKNALAFIELEEYEKAYDAFNQIINLAPKRHEGWYGLFLAESEMCTIRKRKYLDDIDNALECNINDDEEKDKIKTIRKVYSTILKVKDCHKDIIENTKILSDKKEKETAFEDKISFARKDIKKETFYMIFFIIFAIIWFIYSNFMGVVMLLLEAFHIWQYRSYKKNLSEWIEEYNEAIKNTKDHKKKIRKKEKYLDSLYKEHKQCEEKLIKLGVVKENVLVD